jgi:hypothetical protein
MWTTPLNSTGSGTPTHYISSGYIPAEFVALAPSTTWTLDEDGNWVASDIYPGDAAAVYGFAQEAGLPYTLAQITSVLSRSDGSAQEPFTAMGRMGLKIINPSEIL